MDLGRRDTGRIGDRVADRDVVVLVGQILGEEPPVGAVAKDLLEMVRPCYPANLADILEAEEAIRKKP